jgi:hypothetical protein
LARSKAKLLRILPDLAEEEEFRGISPSSFLKLRRPERPERPCLDLYLDFPTLPEPASLTRSRATNLLPMCFKRPTHSPTSSISSSSDVSFMSTASSQLSSTPATSDDEAASSTSKPSSSPDVKFKRPSSKSLPALPQFSDNLELPDSEWDEESDGDDLEWIAQEMKDFVSLYTFLPDDTVNARPESFLPNRSSKRLNNLSFHGPSAQLDPTFPFTPKKLPAPTDPLPSPPVSSSPISSLQTPSSSASVSSSSMTTTSIRPPPRHSLPRDVDELMQMDRNDFELIEDGFAQEWPDSLSYDYLGSPLTSLGFEVHDLPKRKSSFIGNALPDSPIEKTHFPDPSIHQTLSPSSPPHQLRSRWSTSTLSSQKQLLSPSLSSWMTKFSLKDKKSSTASPPPLILSITAAKTVQKQKHRRFNGADLIRSRYESEELHIDRHNSQSSRASSDSNESAPSVGLKRKPIPVHIL